MFYPEMESALVALYFPPAATVVRTVPNRDGANIENGDEGNGKMNDTSLTF
jgi:hypothetical protein